MMGIFGKISNSRVGYDVWNLVNRRVFASDADLEQPLQVISDIDKTYLETAFETLGGIAKIALESADEKKSIVGARDFLRHIKWGIARRSNQVGKTVPLHFVSSSPPQLRSVLEEKISMDGLTWSSDSFKDQIYNIKRGQLSLLKHQVSYKMASILSLCSMFKRPEKILLIGDNAETDPFIYLLVKKILQGEIDQKTCVRLMGFLEVPSNVGQQIFERCGQLVRCIDVQIMIRTVPKKKVFIPETFQKDFYLFKDYFEASLTGHSLGLLSIQDVRDIMILMHNFHGVDLDRLYSLVFCYCHQVGGETLRFFDTDPIIGWVRQAVECLNHAEDDKEFVGSLKSGEEAVNCESFDEDFIYWAKEFSKEKIHKEI